MRFVLTRDPVEFAARTASFLAERIEGNLLATVTRNLLDGVTNADALCAYGLDSGDEVQFAAVRTPPWFLLTSELDAGLANDLLDLWLEEDPDLPGVDGVPGTARAVAAGWAQRTGGQTRCRMHAAMHVLEEVRDPPRPAPGGLRLARDSERLLLVGWMEAFVREAGVVGLDQAEAMVDARLARDGLLVWENSAPVSMVGSAPPLAGVVRVGPVYTPPEHRQRGYAGSAVAASSRRALAGGAGRCMLFADLANPTSNKIYAEVGFRRLGDWEEHAFERA